MIRVKEGMSLALTQSEAMKLLRSKSLPPNIPFELLEILPIAYPGSIRGEGEEYYIDYFSLLLSVAHDFIPAFKTGKVQGRPEKNTPSLVKAVDDLIADKKMQGRVIGVLKACDILARGKFPDANRQAYYRERKKLYR
jgi:hypothetical protein